MSPQSTEAQCLPNRQLASRPLACRQEVDDQPASLGVTCGQHVASPAVISLLHQGYCCNSVASQISHTDPTYIEKY